MIRRYALITVVLFLTLFTGWHMNNFTRYVTNTLYKAELCDKLECEKAAQIKELRLPLKGE